MEASVSTKPKAKSDAIETVETAAQKAADATAPVNAAAEANVEASAKTAEKSAAIAKQQAEKATARTTAGLDDLSAATRNACQTWLQSTDTLAKGFQRVNKSMLSFAQYSFDANLNAARQLMSCASVNEAMEIQASHLKSSLDSLLAESSKVSEIASSAMTDAFAPIESELKGRFEKLWKPLAA